MMLSSFNVSIGNRGVYGHLCQHFPSYSPYYSPYDVTYDVIGNPHYSASYPYVIVGLGLELVLQLEAGAHLYDVIMTS